MRNYNTTLYLGEKNTRVYTYIHINTGNCFFYLNNYLLLNCFYIEIICEYVEQSYEYIVFKSTD